MTFELLNCEFIGERVAVYLHPECPPSLFGVLTVVIHESDTEAVAIIAADDGETYRIRDKHIARLEAMELDSQ